MGQDRSGGSTAWAVAVPLQHQQGGVVLQRSLLVLQNREHEPGQRLRRGLPAGLLAHEQVDEPVSAEERPVGGSSDVWRPFLLELANNAGEWVKWTALCNAINRTPREASGMLGAAERRCKQLPPYDKAYEDGQHWFRMPVEVADVIRELAGQE